MTWRPLKSEDDEPKTVGAALPAITRRFGLAAPRVLSAVFSDWEGVVGSTVARHVRPVGLRSTTLLLDVEDPAWVTEVGFLHDDLIRRVNEVAGEGAVTELSVRVRPAPSARRRRPDADAAHS